MSRQVGIGLGQKAIDGYRSLAQSEASGVYIATFMLGIHYTHIRSFLTTIYG